jgi:alcohol dehydrogenase (cytochrome c)
MIVEKGGKARIYPALQGGNNWAPMSFNPTTGLLYINTLDFGMDYETLPAEQVADLKPGQPHYGVNRPGAYDPDKRGYLRAVDPLTGKAKWSIPFKSPNICDTAATGGGLVFTGQLTGEFIAVDSDTGMILWQFQTPSGVVGQPTLGEGWQTICDCYQRDWRRVRTEVRRSQSAACPGWRHTVDVQAI